MDARKAVYRFYRRVRRRVLHHLSPLLPKQASIDTDYFVSEIRSLIHVGANLGQERAQYAYHDLKVLWIEALPDIFARLQQNIASFPNQEAACALTLDKAGEQHTFNVANNEGASSSIFDFDLHSEVWPDVKFDSKIKLVSSTLDEVAMPRAPVGGWDALVMDTQGSEVLVLKGGESILDQVKYVRTEAADFEAYKGQAMVRDLVEFLAPRGFTLTREKVLAEHLEGGRLYELVFERV